MTLPDTPPPCCKDRTKATACPYSFRAGSSHLTRFKPLPTVATKSELVARVGSLQYGIYHRFLLLGIATTARRPTDLLFLSCGSRLWVQIMGGAPSRRRPGPQLKTCVCAHCCINNRRHGLLSVAMAKWHLSSCVQCTVSHLHERVSGVHIVTEPCTSNPRPCSARLQAVQLEAGRPGGKCGSKGEGKYDTTTRLFGCVQY